MKLLFIFDNTIYSIIKAVFNFITHSKGLYIRLGIILNLFLSSCEVQNIAPQEVKINLAFDSNMVFFIQRSNENRGQYDFLATIDSSIKKAEIKFINELGGTPTDWQALKYNENSKQLSGQFNLVAGGYKQQIRFYNPQNQLISEYFLDQKVSIGEVFATIGHSLVEGQDPYFLMDYDLDWVNMVLWDAIEDTKPNPSFWGKMANSLMNKFQVPIMVYNCGIGGSSSYEWGKSAIGEKFDSGIFDWEKRYPFKFFEDQINTKIKKSGIRAILVIHGENDWDDSEELILESTKLYVQKTRELFNLDKLSFIFAKSLQPLQLANQKQILSAHNRILSEIPYSFNGPDLTLIKDRWDGTHFDFMGLEKAASSWANVFDDNFFKVSSPLLKSME